MRIIGFLSPPRPRLKIMSAALMRSAARMQLSASSFGLPAEVGAPHTLITASPINLSTTPCVMFTHSTIAVIYSFKNSTTSAGVSFSEIAVNERMSEKKTVTSFVSPPSASSPRAASSAISLLIKRPNESLSRSRSASPLPIFTKLDVKRPISSFVFGFKSSSYSPCSICPAARARVLTGRLIDLEKNHINTIERNNTITLK